jgi:hypothetical protein
MNIECRRKVLDILINIKTIAKRFHPSPFIIRHSIFKNVIAATVRFKSIGLFGSGLSGLGTCSTKAGALSLLYLVTGE